MSAGRYVATVDVGSSSVRAMLWDFQGRQARGLEVQHEYAAANEIDADRLVRLVVRSLVELMGLAGPRRAERIAAVGFSTFWHGLLGADDSKRALTPVYLWSDVRSSSAAEHLRERLDADDVWRRTGCPLHASYWAAKLWWLREERPDLWRRQVRWLSFGDLLFWRLFGRLGTSLSMASGTGLLRIDDRKWDEELLAELRIGPESLPPLAKAEQGLTPAYARVLPQLVDKPWVHAAGDGALANLGSGSTTKANRAITIGTSAALRVMHGPSTASLPRGLWRYRLDESRLVTGGALSNGGNLRDWLLTNLRTGSRFPRAALGAHGLTFLPHLFGERSLGYAADAFGAVAGLTSASTADDIMQAAYEAVAVQLAQIDSKLDEILPGAARLVASGAALLNSPEWMQMIADATGRPVAALRVREASSRGAALFAMESLGIKAPAVNESGTAKVFIPRRMNAAAYRKIEARQAALYQALIKDRILDRIP
ncbi:MAG TPA: gluconokinase [Candidatus Eisenbacteria bacterium]|nr:gluconokinase [Candidatus Eisenbacteria bacterium]